MSQGSPGKKAGQMTIGRLCEIGLCHSICIPEMDHARTDYCGFTSSPRPIASLDRMEFADSQLAVVHREEIEEQPSPDGILLLC